MRHALTIALFVASTVLAAQTPYERVEVVNVDSTMSAERLYSAAKRAFAETFKDAQEVIQMDDPTSHTIMGKGSIKFVGWYATVNGWITYSVEVGAKQGRYRVRFYGYQHTGTSRYNVALGITEQAASMGTIVDGPDCWVGEITGNPKKDAKNTARRLEYCKGYVLPDIAASQEAFLENMRKATTSSASSDW